MYRARSDFRLSPHPHPPHHCKFLYLRLLLAHKYVHHRDGMIVLDCWLKLQRLPLTGLGLKHLLILYLPLLRFSRRWAKFSVRRQKFYFLLRNFQRSKISTRLQRDLPTPHKRSTFSSLACSL